MNLIVVFAKATLLCTHTHTHTKWHIVMYLWPVVETLTLTLTLTQSDSEIHITGKLVSQEVACQLICLCPK